MISRGCLLITSRIGARSILLRLEQLAEDRRLEDAEPDPEADADQDDAERRTGCASPRWRNRSPDQALKARIARLDRNRPDGHAELRPRRDQAAAAVAARPLHRDQHRAAPFAADADALEHAQHGQDDRAPDADRCVGRHEGDQEGGDAHQHQRGDQRRLAADAVAVVAEDRGADRPADEADEVGAERASVPVSGSSLGKNSLREDQAGGGASFVPAMPAPSPAYPAASGQRPWPADRP